MGRWTALAAGVAAAAGAAGAAIWARRKARDGKVTSSPRPTADRGRDAHAKAADRLTVAAGARAQPTVVAPFGPVRGDSLQAIRGIGAVSEERLRAVGVNSVQQIAAWSSEDVASIAAQIKVSPERIRREDWVGQAQAAERR